MNHIHVAACWSSLSRLSIVGKPELSGSEAWQLKTRITLQPLVQHTMQLMQKATIGGRQLVNVAYGGARSMGNKLNESFGYFCKDLASALEAQTDHLNERELANSAWAFATIGRSDSPLFARLGGAVKKHMGSFGAQALSNTA
eukprot:gnl/MRDRNA2_/MRDRNA2_37518_c0_seq1.p1 gnl/MRDRNA2_/MRDRNA2_37518_c0~~gnl/MRDRNA2_/MRDRNA2_37518_c0_seq1.p1  ORF type:complete len:143 (+),score=20.14 gnl/MRDRNA2_/MRDRNA2_37518_c0_seq1:284-712(+)